MSTVPHRPCLLPILTPPRPLPCPPPPPPREASVEFILDEQYEVTWHVPAKGVEPLPIFQTSSFTVDRERQLIELMGGPDGQSFAFDISHQEGDLLLLGAATEGLQGGMVIKIKRVWRLLGTSLSPSLSPLTPSHPLCHP